jgi:hypothetical protein
MYSFNNWFFGKLKRLSLFWRELFLFSVQDVQASASREGIKSVLVSGKL